MNPLQSRLADLRRRLRLVVTFRGGCWALAALIGSVALACLIDQAVYLRTSRDLPALIRAGFLVAILGGAGYVAYRFLFRPMTARTDDLSLALRVEEQYPELNDALASTVQFLQQSPAVPGVSPALQREAVQRAMRLAQGCDFNKAVDARGARPALLALLAAGALVVPLLLWNPGLAGTSLARLADPFGGHLWPGHGQQTRLTVEFPARIGFGQRFTIRGKVAGIVPADATIEFQNLVPSPQTFKVVKNEDGTAGTLTAPIDMSQQRRDFRFRVRANDAVSPKKEGEWHTVELRHPPALAPHYGKPSPQLTIHYPRYTDLPSPVKLAPGSGNVEGVPGTHVQMVAATDRPIARAWVEYAPVAPLVEEASVLGMFGAHDPLNGAALLAGGHAVWGRTYASIKPDGREFTLAFQPWTMGVYALVLEDAEKLIRVYEFDARIFPDPPPAVSFVRPAGNQSVVPNASLTIRALAEDEVYAVRSMYLEYRRKDRDGKFLDDGPRRIPLYDGGAVGRVVPQLLACLAARPVPLAAGYALRLRPKRVEAETRWSLAGLANEGDTLLVQACALDFNDLAAFPTPGRSPVLELKVVGRKKLVADLDDAQAQMQQALMRLREMQQRAIEKVRAAEEQWRVTGKLRPEDAVNVAEAEQLQKQIQERVGEKPDEGLRGELARLRQTMRDNKLPRSATEERLKAMKDELDRLAREHLPEIEPRLTNARRELENRADARPPAPKERGDLDRAREHQEEVKRSIDDLLKFLDNFAPVQQVRGELRQILDKQRELQQETEKLELNTRKAIAKEPPPKVAPKKDEKPRPVQLSPEDEATRRELAARQKALADQMQGLLDKMKRMAEERDLRDPRGADMLRKAAEIGGEDREKGHWVVPEMRNTSKQIHDPAGEIERPQLNRAIGQQEETIKALEKMVEAMEEGRDAEVERILKKQRAGGKQLEKLKDDLERLKKKVDKARQIADPKERQKELQKLAEEQRDLQAQAEKQARELQRLQAPRAGKALDQAGQKMERAAKRLDQGEAPEDEQKEAIEQVQEAQDQLQQAQERTEEELAREQLARIADRLKGLKERQDAAITESARLHKEVLRKGHWTLGLLNSLEDHGKAQQGLGKETASLKEKLKGAAVFELILEKAAKSMDGAAAQIGKRREKGLNRQGPAALEKAQLADEAGADKETQKLQLAASRRLQRLLDAIKPELEARRPPKKDNEKKQQPKEGDPKDRDGKKEAQKGGLPGDGIPPVAQLKALREEQQEVNDRTRAFAERHPNEGNLTEPQRAELDALRLDQERLFELFQKMLQSAAGPQGANGGNP